MKELEQNFLLSIEGRFKLLTVVTGYLSKINYQEPDKDKIAPFLSAKLGEDVSIDKKICY